MVLRNKLYELVARIGCSDEAVKTRRQELDSNVKRKTLAVGDMAFGGLRTLERRKGRREVGRGREGRIVIER